MNHAVMPTYTRLPVVFEHGEGAWLWDIQGKRYFDAISGIAVCSLGHAHPAISSAITEQATKLIHTSNLYRIELQEKLATELCTISSLENAFFCNSGAEANEAALKLARRYGHTKGIEYPSIIVMKNSFHGRTLFTLSATGNAKVQEGFEPLISGFIRVPYNDTNAIAEISDPNVVAILVEPVQGEGGVQIPDRNYLPSLRQICDERSWLLMLDEVQTGMGRTGTWFGFQRTEGAQPDVMTLAKALGNGIPIGACLARGPASTILTPGKHASTFGGNPLACRVALTVAEVVRDSCLLNRVTHIGNVLLDRFQCAFAHHPSVVEVRGLGLMIGVELKHPCADIVKFALERGLLINVTAERTIRLLPPFILTDDEVEYFAEQLITVVTDYTTRSIQ